MNVNHFNFFDELHFNISNLNDGLIIFPNFPNLNNKLIAINSQLVSQKSFRLFN